MEQGIDIVRQAGRRLMRVVARGFNTATGGKVSPNAITLVGVAMHIPIAILIATDHWMMAAFLLLFFGLFDTLDGDLARLQKRESPHGMLLDSATDRVKEVVLYVGIAYAFAATDQEAWLLAVTAVAMGSSLLTSYVNAIGDSVMLKYPGREHAANKAFRGGLFPFEIRMLFMIVGLLADQLPIAVSIIAIGAAYTAVGRILRVYGAFAGSR